MTDKIEDILAGQPFVFSISGSRDIQPWEEEFRAIADQIQALAIKLGLVAHREPVDDAIHQKKWTFKRASREDVFNNIHATDGASPKELSDRLYHEEPWTHAQEIHAITKIRVHLHKLRQERRVLKRFDTMGRERWYQRTP